MRITAYAQEALTHRYGERSCDVAEHKVYDQAGKITGHRMEITRWDEYIAGVPQPSEEQLLQDVQDYIDNILPDKQAENDEADRLHAADIKFKKLTLSALKDINKAQPNLFGQETKALYQELKALLR